jgi:hypothetical protein
MEPIFGEVEGQSHGEQTRSRVAGEEGANQDYLRSAFVVVSAIFNCVWCLQGPGCMTMNGSP